MMFHFHSQNLGNKGQSMFWHGRCWWRILENSFRFEWRLFGTSSTKIGFDFAGDEDDFSFHIALWGLFSLFFTVEKSPLRKLFKDIAQGFGYETSLGFYDGAIWVHVLHNELWGAQHIKEPKWMPRDISIWKACDKGFGFYVSIHYVDMLLGRQVYHSELIGEKIELGIQIHPDTTFLGLDYKAAVQMTRDSWTRARWPFPVVMMRARVDCIPPIPFQGRARAIGTWAMTRCTA